MLDTYGMDDINTQAIRELTTEVDALKRKANKGGGGSSDIPKPTIADAGKVLGVNDQGKYALVEGGGGGAGIPILHTITAESSLVGTYIEPVIENMSFLLAERLRDDMKILIPIIALPVILSEIDVNSELELNNLFTYNDDGTTSPYSGVHNIWMAEDCYEITAGVLSTLTSVFASTVNYAMIIDLDTGKMVYQQTVTPI